MGCWNKTCALSNLHINAGDPVYVFIMEQNPVGENHCYTTHLYRPILIPFYSEYDDYGRGENSSGVGLNIIINALKKQLIEMEVGENEYHDIEVKKDKFDEQLLFESIRENRLYIRNVYAGLKNQPENVPVEFVMMRKDVVDKILEKFQFEEYTHVDGVFTKVFYGFSDVLEDVNNILLYIQKQVEEAEKDKDSVAALLMKFNRAYSMESMLKERGSKKSKLLYYFDSHHYSGIVNIMLELYNFIENDQIDLARELLIDAYKGAFIASFMERTRKSWIPQCGEGSQDTDLDGHKALAQTILEVIEEEEKEREEWEDA